MELYTELPGHSFALNADFSTAARAATSYDALVIPGGRFTEPLSAHAETLSLVKAFAAAGKPIAVTCHAQLILVAAGVIGGGAKCTGFFSVKPAVTLAGGAWVEPDPLELCVVDRSIISAIGWPAHSQLLASLVKSLGAQVHGPSVSPAVLFLIGDFVEDYEVNVAFRALGGLGCRVEAACPSKKKGEACVTAVHDFEGAQVCSEKRGHNFAATIDWADVAAGSGYDGLVIPGGRSPELLVMNDAVTALVKEFAEKNRVVSAIGNGLLVLAAAGILKGKKCASNDAMKVMVKLGGGEAVETAESLVDGQLLTAAGWPALPRFISDHLNLLGITVTF